MRVGSSVVGAAKKAARSGAVVGGLRVWLGVGVAAAAAAVAGATAAAAAAEAWRAAAAV